MFIRNISAIHDTACDTASVASEWLNRDWFSSVVAVLLIGIAVGISGCATSPPPLSTPTVVAEPVSVKPTALSVDADNALKAAEQTVIETRVRRALWTAATDQLNRARVAAKIFDSDLTLKHAREVIALCQLSLQQKQSPPVTW